MNAWISVDDRLPEDVAWVLVCQDSAMNCMGFTPGKGFQDWTFNTDGCHNIHIASITHWMPLPDPPELQGGE